MNIISYAQNFEDVVLWRAFSQFGPGYYIDIGAQDPLVDSVSRLFYENGWRGLHVEASPEYAAKLRLARPDEKIVEAAVDSEKGSLLFYRFDETGLSTGNADIAAEHRNAGYECTEINVPRITLDQVLSFIPKDSEPRWLKIDVEGMEQSVLQSWTQSPIRPWIVIVESTLPGSQTESFQGWESILLDKGYEFVYFDGVNRFYLHSGHSELRRLLSVPPNVFDRFAISGTATNSFSDRWKAMLHQEHVRLQTMVAKVEHAEREVKRLREEQLVLKDEQLEREQQFCELEQRYEEVLLNRAEALSALDRVLSSSSWKMTYPLRASAEGIRNLIARLPPVNLNSMRGQISRLVNRLILWSAPRVASNPRLRSLALRFLKRFPLVHQWVIQRVKGSSQLDVGTHDSSSGSGMTPRARRFAQLLGCENREDM